MRSIARCVLPVLVGPSTAVTAAPGARSLWNAAEGEKAIFFGCFLLGAGKASVLAKVSHIATYMGLRFKLWNDSRTKGAPIADFTPPPSSFTSKILALR